MVPNFVSIIIPCYNSGRFLPDALESFREYAGNNYEVVIVDDGSTDHETITVLNNLKESNYRVIRQKNAGPAAARNTGAKEAQGEYLLFLDSDNTIKPEYISKGIAILSSHPEVAVVYGNASFFGLTTKPRFTPYEFDLSSLLFGNYIDMCAVVRKKVWEEVGGLDENKILFGHEDWDFWIRIGLKGWKFKYLNEVLFAYRIREDSMLHYAQNTQRLNETKAYICQKYAVPIMAHYKKYYQQFLLFRDRPFRSFIKFFYFRYILRKRYSPMKR